MAHFVISANRTADGGVVYLTADRRWTTRLAAAASCDGKAAADPGLRWARSQEAVVCDPHLIKVRATGEGPTALDTKQAIRAAGPEATLAALGFLDAAPDAAHIHRAELPEAPLAQAASGEAQARA